MGLLEKANAFARSKSLLRRSLQLLSEEPAAPSDAPLPEAEAPEPVGVAPGPVAIAEPASFDAAALESLLVADAAALASTIDLPSRLFGLLKERLGIVRGALLLLDAGRGVLAPWAACGYDAATLRRMRLPPDDPALARLASGTAVVVEDAKALADLRRFFSSRESGAIERVLLAPLAADGRLAGVLLATETTGPAAETAAILGRAGAAVMPALARLRDVVLRPARGGPASPHEAREEFTRFLTAHPPGARPLTVFALSLERCRKRIAAANPWLDPFRLEEDLRAVVSGFAADLGRALHLGRLRFLVAARDLGAADTDLFAHQLASLLGSLFHATAFEPADAEIGATRGFPPGGGATAEAAAELLATLAAS